MTKYQTEIEGDRREIDVPTGDYRMVAVIASAMAGGETPRLVKVWCDDLVPQYGPYWYRIRNDGYGNLVVSAGV